MIDPVYSQPHPGPFGQAGMASAANSEPSASFPKYFRTNPAAGRQSPRKAVRYGKPSPGGGLYAGLSASPMQAQGGFEFGGFGEPPMGGGSMGGPRTPFHAELGRGAGIGVSRGALDIRGPVLHPIPPGSGMMVNRGALSIGHGFGPFAPQQPALPGSEPIRQLPYYPPRPAIPMGGPPRPKDLVEGTRGWPYGKPEPLTRPGMEPRPAAPGPMSSGASPTSPWEAGFRDSLRGPSPGTEEAFRDSLRGPGGFRGGVAAEAPGPGLFDRLKASARSFVGGSAPTPSAGPPPTASPSAAPSEIGGRLSAGFNSMKQAGVKGTAVGLGKGLIKGTLLNPYAWGALASDAAASGADLEGVMRGPNGINPGGTSIANGLSNMAHGVPGIGGLTGAAWDWTLGGLVGRPAQHAGDLAALGVGAAMGNTQAQAGLHNAWANLSEGLGNLWHGKPFTPPDNPEVRNYLGPQTNTERDAQYVPDELARHDAFTDEAARRIGLAGPAGLRSVPPTGQAQDQTGNDIPSLMGQLQQLMLDPKADPNSPLYAQGRKALADYHAGGMTGRAPVMSGPAPASTPDVHQQLSDALARRALDGANGFGLRAGTWMPPALMQQAQGDLANYVEHQGILGRQAVGMGQNQAAMMQAQAEMAKAQAMSEELKAKMDPAFLEANLGMQPGEMAARRAFQQAPGLSQFHNKPDLTAEILRHAMAGHEGDEGYGLGLSEIIRQQMIQNPEWMRQQTMPGGLDWAKGLFGYPEDPRYEQNRRFLAPFGYMQQR